MSQWKRLKQDCPICAGARKSKDCRQSLQSGLVFCHDSQANPIGWVFREFDKHGFGIWQDEADAQAFAQQSQAERDRERQFRQQQQQQRRQETIAAQLPAVDRDRWNRRLQGLLTLEAADRANLIDRGFLTEWIEADGYRSVRQWQDLPAHFPLNFPGRTQRGNLAVTEAGYLCPIPNIEGQIVGYQIRRRDGANGRYGWLSAQAAPVKLDDEMPIGVYEPLDGRSRRKEIWLVDSPAIKASLTRYRLDVPTIGATNGSFSSSPETTKHTLQVLSERYGTKQLVLALDAGDVQNVQVCPQKLKQVEFLTELGYTVKFAWWGQVTKQECDIDELEPSQYRSIRRLSVRSFKSIAVEHGGLEAPNPVKPNEPRTGVAWDLWRKSRQFQADHTSTEPFFKAPIPNSGTLAAVRSGTGTGKTQWLIREVIQQLGERGFLSIGYRNSLLIQFCEQVGLLKQGNWYHLQQDLKGSPDLHLIRDPHSKILCCIDSLMYFDPQDFDGKIVILDEVESIVNQFLKSDTAVSFQREKIKALFIEMLQRCDRVIILDGHLRDATIDYLKKLVGDSKKFVCYANTYQGNKGKVEFLEGVESAKGVKMNDRSPVLQAILSNQQCFVVGSDSQEELQALERKLMEAGRKTLRFDGTTSNKAWAKEFLKDPAAYILKHQIEALLYSPSAEAGLSIDLKGYFSDAYFLYFGVVTTNAQLQTLARVRDPQMQIHITCPMQGLPSEAVSKSAIPQQLQAEVMQYVLDCATVSLQGITVEDLALKLAQQLVALSADAHFEHEMFLTAIDNHERANLRDCLREALKESGYEVKSIIGQPSSSVAAIKDKRNEIRQEKSKLLFTATEITTAQADQKSRSFEATEADRYAISKRRLLDRLPGIEAATYVVPPPPPSSQPEQPQPETPVTPEPPAMPQTPVAAIEKPVFDEDFVRQVRFESKGLISQIEMRYLIEHSQVAQQLQQVRWHKRLCVFTDPDEPDSSKRMNLSNYHSRWLKIHRLLELGIEFFLQPGVTWDSETPQAIEFWQAAKHPRNARAIGRSVGRSSVCGYIGEVIRSLGLRTESTYCHSRKTHIYQIDATADPIRSAIYASVEQRFDGMLGGATALDWEKVTRQFEEAQSPTQQGSEVRSLATVLFKRNRESDPQIMARSAEASKPSETIPETLETVQDVAGMLRDCEEAVEVAMVRSLSGMTRSLWESAWRLLSLEKQNQLRGLMQWLFDSGQIDRTVI